MANLYSITIIPKTGTDKSAVDSAMNLAMDWFRIGRHTWIVKTTGDANVLYGRLEHLVKPDGTLFITKIDSSDSQGWLTRTFWEWLGQNVDK